MVSIGDASSFMPHGYCFLWTPALLWIYIVSDFAIFLSYFSIPFCLWYFMSKRPDLPFRSAFLMFGLFVMACGATHLMGLITIWQADYWLDAGIKLFTALVSLTAAMMLWRLMPAALSLPSRAEVERANKELKDEIARRQAVEADLRRSNAALEGRTAELQAVNQELDGFAYAVSHDLRAPLRAMSGFSRALMEDAPAKLSPDELIYLEHIGKAGEQMGQLIDGLLALSRHVRAELRRDIVDVTALAAQIRYDLTMTAPERHVTWQMEPGLTVVGDQRLVGVVLSNLLSNAWKYTGKTAEAVISLSAHVAEGRRWLTVSDNGVGFSMEHANRLFLPFQRLHRQDEFPGIGIGLATVYRIIRRHGGQIRAEAAIGQGARFSFFLPTMAAEVSEE